MATKSVIKGKGAKGGAAKGGRTSGTSAKRSPGAKASPAGSSRAGAARARGTSASSSPTGRASSPSASRSGGDDGTTVSLNGGPAIPLNRFVDAAREIGNAPKPRTRAEAGETDDASRRIIVDVPSLIGAVCGSKYELSAVRVDVGTDGSAILQACDGKKAAIVVTTSEVGRRAETTGARYIPAELARPAGRGATALRFAANPNKSELFDTEFAWVDGERGVYRQQPDIPKFPNVGSVFPRAQVGAIVVGINAEQLLQLARAVNSPGAPEGVGTVTLIINPPADASDAVDTPVAVIGSVGIGVMVPGRPIRSAALSTYERVRCMARAVGSGGDVGEAPDLAGEQEEQPAPEPAKPSRSLDADDGLEDAEPRAEDQFADSEDDGPTEPPPADEDGIKAFED